MPMFIVLRKVESKVRMGNKMLKDGQTDLWEGEESARWVLDDYTGLKNILKEPQEHGMGKGLPCFWGCWLSLVGHLRHCHRFFRVPFLWKDLGHLIPIGKLMGHDSGLGGEGSIAQGSQDFQTLFEDVTVFTIGIITGTPWTHILCVLKSHSVMSTQHGLFNLIYYLLFII